jgi:hypothetical protein
LILECKTFSVHRGQKKQRKEKLPKKESLLADLSFFQQEVVDYQLHCDLHLVLKSFRKLGTSHMVTHFNKQTQQQQQNACKILQPKSQSLLFLVVLHPMDQMRQLQHCSKSSLHCQLSTWLDESFNFCF